MKINRSICVVVCLILFSCGPDDLEKQVTRYIEEHSGEMIAENQYYFLLNTNSCRACNEVIIKFLNQYESKKPMNLILKANTNRELKAKFSINDRQNLHMDYDLTRSKTNLKMPILINSRSQILEINEINIYNYKKILSKIK